VAGTPFLDLANRRMFVVSLQDNGAGVGGYHAVCLDIDTGAILRSAALADPGAPGPPTFDGSTVDQRGGLNYPNGFLFVTFADFLAFR